MPRATVLRVLAVCIALLARMTIFAGEATGESEKLRVLPEGNGLAAKYPGDTGIERDPSTIFVENFESGDLKKWDDRDGNRPPEVELVADGANVRGGKWAAQLTVPKGKGVGADLTKWFARGYDQVYARWYCRFAPDYDQGNLNHTGGNLVAARARPLLGVSGVKPNGTDRFCTGLEPWRDWKRNAPPGELMFYTYYPDMKRDPSGPYYGNPFKPEKKVLLEHGRWYCLEMMVKANTSGQTDGEQAFWVDGELKGRFTGIRWRATDALKINCFWLLLYIHDNPQTNRIWVDDIVVATEYVGAVKTAIP